MGCSIPTATCSLSIPSAPTAYCAHVTVRPEPGPPPSLLLLCSPSQPVRLRLMTSHSPAWWQLSRSQGSKDKTQPPYLSTQGPTRHLASSTLRPGQPFVPCTGPAVFGPAARPVTCWSRTTPLFTDLPPGTPSTPYACGQQPCPLQHSLWLLIFFFFF